MGVKFRTRFCEHYRAMSEHDTCEAGVAYAQFKDVPFNEKPCFIREGQIQEQARAKCDKCLWPTPAQIEERRRATETRFERTTMARSAIVAHLGGPWKRGTPPAQGAIDCPICGAAGSLRFNRAGSNGHIVALCKTPDCVSWME